MRHTCNPHASWSLVPPNIRHMGTPGFWLSTKHTRLTLILTLHSQPSKQLVALRTPGGHISFNNYQIHFNLIQCAHCSTHSFLQPLAHIAGMCVCMYVCLVGYYSSQPTFALLKRHPTSYDFLCLVKETLTKPNNWQKNKPKTTPK